MKNRNTKLVTVIGLALVAVLTGCGKDEPPQTATWSDMDRNVLVGSCLSGAPESVMLKAPSVCSCYVNRATEKFTPEQVVAEKATVEPALKDIFLACAEEAGLTVNRSAVKLF